MFSKKIDTLSPPLLPRQWNAHTHQQNQQAEKSLLTMITTLSYFVIFTLLRMITITIIAIIMVVKIVVIIIMVMMIVIIMKSIRKSGWITFGLLLLRPSCRWERDVCITVAVMTRWARREIMVVKVVIKIVVVMLVLWRMHMKGIRETGCCIDANTEEAELTSKDVICIEELAKLLQTVWNESGESTRAVYLREDGNRG